MTCANAGRPGRFGGGCCWTFTGRKRLRVRHARLLFKRSSGFPDKEGERFGKQVTSSVHTAEVTTDYVDAPTKDQFRRSSGSRHVRAFVASTMKDVVMVTATAQWGTYDGWQGQRVVTAPQEALDLCAEIDAREGSGRVLVGFTSESGHVFAVGLGSDESCAVYWESADPPYFQSVGTLAPDDRIDFAYDGQHTEFPGTVRISRDSALHALKEFIDSGLRPECINWEET